jgi:hypothetical protein
VISEIYATFEACESLMAAHMDLKMGRQVSFRLPQLYTDAVRVLALQRDITSSEYLRQVVEEDLQAKQG